MTLDYIYKDQLDKMSYFRVPKQMITMNRFKPLSLSAKLLYGLCLDRMSMAQTNSWIDPQGRVYILYPLADIQDDLHISKATAVKCVKELEEFGLIEKHKLVQGVPSVLYVKNYAVLEEQV